MAQSRSPDRCSLRDTSKGHCDCQSGGPAGCDSKARSFPTNEYRVTSSCFSVRLIHVGIKMQFSNYMTVKKDKERKRVKRKEELCGKEATRRENAEHGEEFIT